MRRGWLEGKRALVTAAGQGIGRAIYDRFAEEGAHVVPLDRSAGLITDLPDAIIMDLTDRQAIAGLPERTGPIDILVNAAGIVHAGDALGCSLDDWDAAIGLNMTAMFLSIKAYLPSLLEQGGGSIINIASVASSLIGVPNRFAYGATKAGVIGLTKAVAADYVTQGIRCNAICPGTVETPSLLQRVEEQAASQGRSVEDTYRIFADRQPMRRLGSAREIAGVALHLASDDAAFTTGTTAIVDGGWTLL